MTGGRYWPLDELDGLAAAIPYSKAGMVERQTLDLWNLPIVFLVLLLLKVSANGCCGCDGGGCEDLFHRRDVACSTHLAGAASFTFIVAGLGGEPEYEQRFREQAAAIAEAAEEGGRRARITSSC